MARITTEDVAHKVNGRFELVALMAQRTKDIIAGSKITIQNDRGDKPPVLALREFAAGQIKSSVLKEALLNRLRTKSRVEPVYDEEMAVTSDTSTESFDYLPSGGDVYVTEDYSDLEDPAFDETVSEEDRK